MRHANEHQVKRLNDACNVLLALIVDATPAVGFGLAADNPLGIEDAPPYDELPTIDMADEPVNGCVVGTVDIVLLERVLPVELGVPEPAARTMEDVVGPVVYEAMSDADGETPPDMNDEAVGVDAAVFVVNLLPAVIFSSEDPLPRAFAGASSEMAVFPRALGLDNALPLDPGGVMLLRVESDTVDKLPLAIIFGDSIPRCDLLADTARGSDADAFWANLLIEPVRGNDADATRVDLLAEPADIA